MNPATMKSTALIPRAAASFLLAASSLLVACEAGQSNQVPGNNVLSADEEERAAAFESGRLMTLVRNLAPRANWIDTSDRFWIRNEITDGVLFEIVDAATGESAPAFDHAALATALDAAGVEGVSADALPDRRTRPRWRSHQRHDQFRTVPMQSRRLELRDEHPATGHRAHISRRQPEPSSPATTISGSATREAPRKR